MGTRLFGLSSPDQIRTTDLKSQLENIDLKTVDAVQLYNLLASASKLPSGWYSGIGSLTVTSNQMRNKELENVLREHAASLLK